MRKKKRNSNNQQGSNGFDHVGADSDFYSSSPVERPLYEDRINSDSSRVRKTARHQAASGRRKEAVDIREKMALIAILRAGIILVLLVIMFFLLQKGISIYEENVRLETQSAPMPSPVMQEVAVADDIDLSEQSSGTVAFSGRVESWKETQRLVRSASDLLLRDNIDQAIERCQEALRLDPFHLGALELLGGLYMGKGMFVEAVNTYIRLLSMEPDREEFQLALLKALDAYGDPEASIEVAHWYQDENTYNEEVQRCLANAYFLQESFNEAAEAYDRVLKDSPKDLEALEHQAVAYMRMNEFEKALVPLSKLVSIKFRDPICYKRIAICYAQLERGQECVQVLGKSAHLFGPDTIVMWVQDPQMDPIRRNRAFQSLVDRVGDEEFRKYLEQMADSMKQKSTEEVLPQLELPETETIDTGILRRDR